MAAEDEKVEYGLVVRFSDQSPSFTYGFEAGIIWNQLQSGITELQSTTRVENREVLKNCADYLGWNIEVFPTDVEGWDDTHFERKKPAKGRPNPHGLRLVE